MLRNKILPYNDERTGLIRYLTAKKSFSYFAKTQSSPINTAFSSSDCPFTNNNNDTSSWHSTDKENSWISIKLKHVFISIDSYVLKSSYNYPISWNLQGMNRMKKWENISVVRNDTSLKAGAFGKWNVDVNDFFDELRFVQIGKRIRTDELENNYEFQLKYIEFFGSVVKKMSITLNCNKQMHNNNILSLLIYLS